ncbi:MAG: nuclear transport factor 2 family protein [Patulibacter minatonensis]
MSASPLTPAVADRSPVVSDATAALAVVADRLALAELVSRLGRWLDDPASCVPGSLLAADVTVRSPGGESAGLDRVVAQAERTHAAVTTQHVMTDVIVDLDGDDARLTANLLVAFLAPGDASLAPSYRSGSRYAFGARRTPAGWRLTRIEVDPVWQLGERPVPPAAG